MTTEDALAALLNKMDAQEKFFSTWRTLYDVKIRKLEQRVKVLEGELEKIQRLKVVK